MISQESLTKLQGSYDNAKPHAKLFLKAVSDQFSDLLAQHSIHPVIPVEGRIKEWPSILSKIDRNETWSDVSQIWDFIGLRGVFLFPSEMEQACALIDENFVVRYRSNASDNLSANEFGYRSVHFNVTLKPEWLKLPSLRSYPDFRAEFQIRTLAQHNWAAAAHLLQYKQKSYAPPSVQRSLPRLAALLELVDFELARVANERKLYTDELSELNFDQPLNVDLLASILRSRLPEPNRLPSENYAKLLSDLISRKIFQGTQVLTLLDKHRNQALANDKVVVNEIRSGNTTYENDPARQSRSVYYSHVGLMQHILNLEFGTSWRTKGDLE